MSMFSSRWSIIWLGFLIDSSNPNLYPTIAAGQSKSRVRGKGASKEDGSKLRQKAKAEGTNLSATGKLVERGEIRLKWPKKVSKITSDDSFH
jgi:hypothetical protein